MFTKDDVGHKVVVSVKTGKETVTLSDTEKQTIADEWNINANEVKEYPKSVEERLIELEKKTSSM